MEQITTSRSQENLKKLRELSKELGFDGIRLMIDPQKTTSPESVVDDLCRYLQDEKDGMPNSPVVGELCHPQI